MEMQRTGYTLEKEEWDQAFPENLKTTENKQKKDVMSWACVAATGTDVYWSCDCSCEQQDELWSAESCALCTDSTTFCKTEQTAHHSLKMIGANKVAVKFWKSISMKEAKHLVTSMDSRCQTITYCKQFSSKY